MALFARPKSDRSSNKSDIDSAISRAQRDGRFKLDETTVSMVRLTQGLRSIDELKEFSLRRVTGVDLKLFEILSDRFPGIHTLELDSCGLSKFPERILNLSGLRELSLSSNDLQALPGSLARLRSLEVLMISGCGLTNIPRQIHEMPNLKVLHAAHNRLSGASLSLPPTLQHLMLWGNDLTSVPDCIAEAKALKVLNLSARGTSGTYPAAGRPARAGDWPYEKPGLPTRMARTVGVGGLTQKIEHIPEWLFDSCPNLEWIDFADNRLRFLPKNVANLRRLQGVVLTGNEFEEFPSQLLSLERLRVIDLASNRIVSLPTGSPPPPRSLETLCLAGNPLPVPPEIIDLHSSPDAIWEYIRGLPGHTRPLAEAKLLVVGEGAVGKTSLIRRLISGRFNTDERKTEGIQITRWRVTPSDSDEIAVNTWDFGGQEIMHATHQFFLTKRSVYLLVLDARQSEEQNRIEYWLKIIQSFSGGSPVIVVGNKCEGIRLDIDRRGLRKKYPNIIEICETSCADVVGIDELTRVIATVIDNLDHVRDPLPLSFFDVKEYLESLTVDYLPYDEYEDVCNRNGVRTTHSKELLIGFLHDLGTVLCFRDDPRLRDTNILSPQWVTNGVYRILNSNRASQLKGLLTWQDIDAILADDAYPHGSRRFIAEMMKKFELCFEADDILLVPDLLTKEEPDTGDWTTALRFTIKYEVLPLSVMSRLTVRMNRLVSKGTVWRTGAVLSLDRNRALLRADREDGFLTILISGPAAGRRGLLTAIRAELRAIEATIPGLVGIERVPVPGHKDVWVSYDHLLRLEEAGRTEVVPEGLVETFSIYDLLRGVEDSADRSVVAKNPSEDRSTVDTDAGTTGDEAVPWTPANSMKLGILLITSLILIAGAYAGISWLVGAGVAAVVVAAGIIAIVLIAMIVLRTSGRIGESTMLDGIKSALDKAPGENTVLDVIKGALENGPSSKRKGE